MKRSELKGHLQKDNVLFHIFSIVFGLAAATGIGIVISKIPMSPNLWIAAGVIITAISLSGAQLVASLTSNTHDERLTSTDQSQ